MRTSAIRTSIVMASILTLSLWVALGKDGATAGGGAGAPRARHATPAARGAGGGADDSSGPSTSPGGRTHTRGTTVYMPELRRTSFPTFNSYYMWSNYYSYLSANFGVNPLYFDRFYRNSEPLITPGMLKLTLREPIGLSSEMLDSIDQLQEMLTSGLPENPANRQTLAATSRHIRELAKRIRLNETLSYFDLRAKRNLYNQSENSALGLEAMQKLRGMAADLDHQLRNMYRQSATSTVSVDSYKEPSLESLTKGIEKICKEIETQSKKL